MSSTQDYTEQGDPYNGDNQFFLQAKQYPIWRHAFGTFDIFKDLTSYIFITIFMTLIYNVGKKVNAQGRLVVAKSNVAACISCFHTLRTFEHWKTYRKGIFGKITLDFNNLTSFFNCSYIDVILPKGPLRLRMADRALLAGYPRHHKGLFEFCIGNDTPLKMYICTMGIVLGTCRTYPGNGHK